MKTLVDLEATFEAAAGAGWGVITLPHPFFGVHAARVAEIALKHRLPLEASYRKVVDAGALVYYGVNRSDTCRRAAT